MQLKINHNENNFLNQIKRLPCEPSQSPSEQVSQSESDMEGQRAIQQFRRQIQERFKLSVANKLYSFPRRLISIQDLISSDEESSGQENQQQQQENEALKPISKLKIQNNQLSNLRKDTKQKQKQKEKQKAFKRKQVYYVRESSGKKVNLDQNSGTGFDSKILKIKKKNGKSKQKSKQKKQDSYRGQKQRQTNRTKRFNTEPDNYNYVEVLKMKNKR